MRTIIFFIFAVFSCLAQAEGLSPMEYAAKGDSCKKVFNYREAIIYYDQIEKERPLNAFRDKLFGMAYCYMKLGDFSLSEKYYKEIINKSHFPNNNIASAKVNLASLYNLTGRYDEAIRLIEEAKPYVDNDTTNTTLANSYLLKGKTDKAISVYNEVISKQSSAKDRIYYIASQNRGNLLLNSNKIAEAITDLETSCDYFSSTDAKKYQTMGNLALAKGKTGKTNDAIKLIDTALNWFATNYGKNHFDYIKCLWKKGEILYYADKFTEATEAYKEFYSREKDNIIRYFSAMTEAERLAYWNSRRPLFTDCYKLEDHAPKFLYDIALFSKSMMLLANRNFLNAASMDKNTEKQYEELVLLRRQQKQTQNPQVFDSLEVKAHNLETSLLKNMDMKSFKEDLDITSNDISKKLKNDIAIEFVKYSKNLRSMYGAIVLDSKGDVKFQRLFDEDSLLNYKLKGTGLTIEETIERGSYKPINKLYTNKKIAAKIWKNILETYPKTNKIYFSPDGILHKIGIEYMLDSLNTNLSAKDVYRLSSTRTLLNKYNESKVKMLLVSGVKYDDMSKMTRAQTADRATSEVLRSDNMPPCDGRQYPYLSNSVGEADSIASKFNDKKFDILKDASATEDTIKRILPNYSIIHIATHGYTYSMNTPYTDDECCPVDLSVYRSGVILAGANEASNSDYNDYEDGILSANEVSELNLQGLKLIVLSACQTALGENIDDSTIGLIRGLKKAGTQQIVASLWEVNDEATLKLMTYLYEGIAKGQSPHTALCNAQEKLKKYEVIIKSSAKKYSQKLKRYIKDEDSVKEIKTTPFNSPCYWAPFIIIDSVN